MEFVKDFRKTGVTAAIAVALFVACGPSFRRTYESDNAFERCFGMDYNPSVSVEEKTECWIEWLGDRVYNQPEDKISYARLRLNELEGGVSIPGPPGPEGAFDARPAAEADSDDERDSDRYAGPVEVDAGPAERDAGLDSQAPVTECEKECKTAFSTCRQECASDAGVSDDCLGACEREYRPCMQRCFTD